MSEHTNPYGMSFIQTAAGAVITGDIKRYETYEEMDTDPAPSRLASVANASHDEEYDVPSDHVGGVLYQRDTISNDWILLYSESDLAVPTYVNWEHILNIPPWVGGITHNRVKLTEDRLADLRTTYYSFGRYKLIVPRADLKRTITKRHRDGTTTVTEEYAIPLGEEIVLEQYQIPVDEIDDNGVTRENPENPSVGFILIPYEDGDIRTATSEVFLLGRDKYQVIFTYAPASAYTDGTDTTITSHAYAFRLICTEDDDGKRYWSLCTTNDEAAEAIRILREEQSKHLLDSDPHGQYVRKLDLNHYLVSATNDISGLVTLAVRSDLDTNNTTKAVTPYLLKTYVDEAIIYRYNVLDRKLQQHIDDSNVHITVGEKIAIQQMQEHMDNWSIHVSPEDRRRWNSQQVVISGGGSVPQYVLDHPTDPDAHHDLLETKQDVLTQGTWIKIEPGTGVNTGKTIINCSLFAGNGISIDPTPGVNYGKISCCDGTYIKVASGSINCMLKGGSGISISETPDANGKYAINCTVPSATPATTETPGIVKIVTEITDGENGNKDNETDAVTPKALSGIVDGLLNSISSIRMNMTQLPGIISCLDDVVGLVRMYSTANEVTTSDNTIRLKLSDMTKGCLVLPFTCELEGKVYSLAVEWGMSNSYKPPKTTVAQDPPLTASSFTNTFTYMMIDNVGYYRLKKILFANTRIYHPSFEYKQKTVWQKNHAMRGNMDARIIAPVSYTESAINNPSLPQEDGIASLLILLDKYEGGQLEMRIMVNWFILGLVEKDPLTDDYQVWYKGASTNPRNPKLLLEPTAGYVSDKFKYRIRIITEDDDATCANIIYN